MDQAQGFFGKSVDNTPTGACVWVALIVTLFFLAGAWGLWNLASYVKQHEPFRIQKFRTITLPSVPALPSPETIQQQVQEQVKEEAAKQLRDQLSF